MYAAIVHLAPLLGAEKSKTPFYIAGGVLVVWALAVSLGLGLRVSGFPSTATAQRVVMAVTAVLVVGAASTAVATSGGSSKAQTSRAGATTPGSTARHGALPGGALPGGAAPAAQGQSKLAQEADPSGQLRFAKQTLTAGAGRVSIDFVNRSPLSHNLTIASGGTVLGATPTFDGGSRALTLNLKPGTYKFFCTVPGHREAGMEGTLAVS